MSLITAYISLAKLRANYLRLRRMLRAAAGPDASLLAVVKGDAYGHGAASCAQALVRAGAEWFGVTNVAEGAVVRQAVHAKARILVMRGSLPDEVREMLLHGLTPVVWTVEQIKSLQAAASHLGLPAHSVAVHLEIDTGMSRQGVKPAHLRELLLHIGRSEQLNLEAVMTHFASAEDHESEQTILQMLVFTVAIHTIHSAGFRPAIIHAGNTSTIDAGLVLPQLKQLATNAESRIMSRVGVGLYGYALELKGAASETRSQLEPVLTWKAKVLAVEIVKPGEHIGYNGTFTAEREMKLALLAVGYADGLRRELSNTGYVLVAGQRARIIGRISMDLTTVDVTAISNVKTGDEAVLIGTIGNETITADDHACIAHTISYEILCGIAARVPRLYSSQNRDAPRLLRL